MIFFDHIKELLLNTGAELFLGMKMGAEAKKVNESFIAAADASLAVVRTPIPGTTWWRGIRADAAWSSLSVIWWKSTPAQNRISLLRFVTLKGKWLRVE